MRVAVAQFGPRVSPRFDHAHAFLVANLSDGAVLKQREAWSKGMARSERVAMLAKRGVNALICGGIDDASARDLANEGIEIYSSITGNIEDALACFLRGELESGMMLGTGGRCCGRWRSRGGMRPAWNDVETGRRSHRGRRREGRGGGCAAGGSGRKQGRGEGPRGPRQGGEPNASRR